jgi:capsular polysaccharide biosynthesis protein
MSDLEASNRLVKTYSAILKSRTTLEEVIKNSELPYTVGQVNSMISTESVNETEVMRVVVTCGDPYDAAIIANSIAEVLPTRVTDIIDGASVSVVELAMPNTVPVAPNIFKYTVLGFILGAFAAALVIAVIAIFDDTIYGEEYILETFDAPILAKVPNLLDVDDDMGYGYRKAKQSAGTND